jgi:hypothetical protein
MFVEKVDVSDVPIDELLSALPSFQRHLRGYGFGLYSIDYTRDFSGVLDRETLVAHLRDTHGFREQGDLAAAMGEDVPTILDNTGSVGNHVCTWVQTAPHGYTVRTKLYNKVVSNFEAGEVRQTFGGHLADYVDCPNAHLRRTFIHPDVQARGCTRIEVSLYACRGEATLSAETGNEVVQAALDIVSPDGEGLFVVQPSAAQWRNLAAAIDRCLVLADRTQGEIYVAWYAHTTTGRVAGVRIRPTKTNTDDDARWEKAIELAIGDFGFRACPIFRVDILGTSIEDGIELAPLRCYTKCADAHTILAASKRPAQLHPDAPDPATLLPATAPYLVGLEEGEVFGIRQRNTGLPLRRGGRHSRRPPDLHPIDAKSREASGRDPRCGVRRAVVPGGSGPPTSSNGPGCRKSEDARRGTAASRRSLARRAAEESRIGGIL